MRINIVIATWNSGEVIERCLDSILYVVNKNTHTIRVIVKDNISDDITKSAVLNHPLNNKVDLIFISKKDSGIYSAWNQALKGVDFLNDDYVMFLGSDDRLNETALDDLSSNKLNFNALSDCFYSDLLVSSSGVNYLRPYSKDCYKKLRWYMSIPHPTLLISWALISRNGFFNENFKIAGDYDFTLKLFLNHPLLKWHKLNNPTVLFSVGGVSTRSDMIKKQIKEKILVKKNNAILIPYFFDIHTLRSIVKLVFKIK